MATNKIRLRKVKYRVGSHGHGNFSTGDIIEAYILLEFQEGDLVVLYSPKDKNGCGCLWLAGQDNGNEIYTQCAFEVYSNEPFSSELTKLFNHIDAPKLAGKIINQEEHDAIKLLEARGYTVHNDPH